MGKSKKRYYKNRQDKIRRHKSKRKRREKRENVGLHKHNLHRQGVISYNPFPKRKLKGKSKKIVLPEELSIINNTEQVLSDFNYYQSMLKEGYNIEFDLGKVESMTPETLAFLVANVADKNVVGNNHIKGNTPKNFGMTKMLLDSGFFNFVKTRSAKPKVKHRLIHKTTDYKVEVDEAKKACLLSVNHTFGNNNKFRPLYEILIECMANTKNHAYKANQPKYDWWLFIYKKPNNVTSITFLDLGIGIFNSYPVLHHVRLKKHIRSNVNIVEDLYSGKIKSRTKSSQRGKGIPHIYNHSQNSNFSKFYLITNNVFSNMKTGEKFKLEHELNGTLYYWELKP